jgi:chemotaxis protein MotB
MAAKEAARQDSILLATQLADQRAKNAELQARASQLKASGDFASQQLNQSQDEIARQQQRMQQLQALIEQQRKATEALRAKIADAMKGFSSDQLSVYSKNGRVYVSMQESLLFPSGSAVVNKTGKDALNALSTALNQNPDINVLVEGHTDTVRIHTAKYEDNWALSVARSTAIIRLLTQDFGVSPTRVTASGRSQYEPVSDNASATGRALNRRTEIILEPKLDEIAKLISG